MNIHDNYPSSLAPIHIDEDEENLRRAIVASRGNRPGQPLAELPAGVDSIDFPIGVVPSLRLLSSHWFPSSDDRCSICLSTHLSEHPEDPTTRLPLFYTPCGHLYHQHCWLQVADIHENHPHQQRLNGDFVTLEDGSNPLNSSLTRCPLCRSYVADASASHELVIPYDPSPQFPPRYQHTVTTFGELTGRPLLVDFVNVRVVEQQASTSERTGSQPRYCGPLAVHNTNRFLNGLHTSGPQAEAALERQLSTWHSLQSNAGLPPFTDLDPADIHLYIQNGCPGLILEAGVLAWAPTDPSPGNPTSIVDALKSFLETGHTLPLIVNNGFHWFSLVLTRGGSNVTMSFMEPWQRGTAASIEILRRFLLPQLGEANEVLRRESAATVAPLPSAPSLSNEESRAIRSRQDQEYQESLARDHAREIASATTEGIHSLSAESIDWVPPPPFPGPCDASNMYLSERYALAEQSAEVRLENQRILAHSFGFFSRFPRQVGDVDIPEFRALLTDFVSHIQDQHRVRVSLPLRT